ncbi:MAG: M48 family metalloprotease [Bacteroidota bacterium]
MNLNYLYPEAPKNAPDHIIEPSASFRKEVRNVVVAIIAFILTYIVLIILAFIFAYLCLALGLYIIKNVDGGYSHLVGIGVIIMGALVFIFLVRFFFASPSGSQTDGIEIKKSDEPELFEFIQKIAGEVGTQFPKKIFLTPEVNASVFYSSNFLSLILPTRKNLNIGLGMVNILNISEFKAVLAHEFGHFSQKSMSLGSYVYYVNQIIFNLLYHNHGWERLSESIAGASRMFAFFTYLAEYIIKGIQWILFRMYDFINRYYMRLSREMEFHADAIAARYSGANNTSQMLRQIAVGTELFQQTIDKCTDLWHNKQAPANIYLGHRIYGKHFAETNNLTIINNIPVISQILIQNRQNGRIYFKDQWASHPTLKERLAHIDSINLNVAEITEDSWTLFRQAEKWQQRLTAFLYLKEEKPSEIIDDPAFEKMIHDDKTATDFPKIFQGYFNHHVISTSQWTKIESQTPPDIYDANAFNQLFAENLDLKILDLQKDLQILNAIEEGNINVKSFDFDGQKYDLNQAETIQETLKHDIDLVKQERDRNDAKIISAFYAKAHHTDQNNTNILTNHFQDLIEITEIGNKFMPHGIPIIQTVYQLSLNDFNLATALVQEFKNLYSKHEPALCTMFQQMPDLDIFPEPLAEQIKTTFISSPVTYHLNNQPNRENLENLYHIVINAHEFIVQTIFERHRALLILASTF